MIEKALHPGVVVDEVPTVLILQTSNRPDAGFSAAAPFYYALQRLQHVKAVNVQATIRDCNGVILHSTEWRIDRRNAPATGTDDPASIGKFS